MIYNFFDLWRRQRWSEFNCTLDLEAWGTEELRMDEKSAWCPTWHQVDYVSWSTGYCVRSIKRGSHVYCKPRGHGNQLICCWLLEILYCHGGDLWYLSPLWEKNSWHLPEGRGYDNAKQHCTTRALDFITYQSLNGCRRPWFNVEKPNWNELWPNLEGICFNCNSHVMDYNSLHMVHSDAWLPCSCPWSEQYST